MTFLRFLTFLKFHIKTKKVLKRIKSEKRGFLGILAKKGQKGPKRGFLGVSREAQKRAKKGSF